MNNDNYPSKKTLDKFKYFKFKGIKYEYLTMRDVYQMYDDIIEETGIIFKKVTTRSPTSLELSCRLYKLLQKKYPDVRLKDLNKFAEKMLGV